MANKRNVQWLKSASHGCVLFHINHRANAEHDHSQRLPDEIKFTDEPETEWLDVQLSFAANPKLRYRFFMIANPTEKWQHSTPIGIALLQGSNKLSIGQVKAIIRIVVGYELGDEVELTPMDGDPKTWTYYGYRVIRRATP